MHYWATATNIMSGAHDTQHVPEHGPWCAWYQRHNITCSADKKAVMHAGQMKYM